MRLPEIDALRDYAGPAGSEKRFRDVLLAAEASGDDAYLAELLTQIARAVCLQRKYEDAEALVEQARQLLEGLTGRDRAAPSFASVMTRSSDAPRLDTPDITPRLYKRMPEPKAHEGPLSHLGHQCVELSHAVEGEVAPFCKTAGEAIKHLFRHSQNR